MKKFFTHRDAVVPMHHPRVLLETAALQGAERSALLEGTGIKLDMLGSPDARISYFQFGVLIGNALKLTNNPALGLDVGRATTLSHMGMLGLALMSSPTLGEAIGVLLRRYRALAPAFELDFRLEGNLAMLIAREAIPLPYLRFSIEMLFTALEAQGRKLIGGPLPIRQLRFAFPEPGHATRYREIADVPILFDQDVNEAAFDVSALSASIAGADPATALLAERYCEQADPAVLTPEGLLAQVRRQLENLRGPAPHLDDLAASLQTSGRSLRRFLHSMGTSYQALLDASQQARAREMVRRSDMGLDQISAELGFSSVRAFRRAFKRWTGTSPAAFRSTSEK